MHENRTSKLVFASVLMWVVNWWIKDFGFIYCNLITNESALPIKIPESRIMWVVLLVAALKKNVWWLAYAH
jgi:hypothetical protein